jgi:hypothetical protein
MKEQLELKEIVGYLPYGLKCISQVENLGVETIKGFEIYSSGIELITNIDNLHILECKPILFPISSLTQFREDLGFVPMVALLAISNNRFRNIQILCETKMYDKREFCTIEYIENGGDVSVKSFSYDSSLSRFITRNKSEKRPLATGYQLQLFEKLHEWKIDIHNLIEKGLAIEVTKEFNPYL